MPAARYDLSLQCLTPADRKSNMHHLQPVVVILGDPDVEAFKKVSTQSHERLLALRGPETQQV